MQQRPPDDDARPAQGDHRLTLQATHQKGLQMSLYKQVSNELAGKLGLVAASAFAAGGVVQIVHPQTSGSHVVGIAGRLVLAFFIVALVAVAPAIIALARAAKPGRIQIVATLVASATTLLGLTCVSSLALGHDGVWFNVIAPLTNATWLFGSIALAVSLKRAGRVPTLIAIGLPLAWITTIPLATFGGGLVSGAYFALLAYSLMDRSAQPEALAAARA
jgi:hypothetical protein